MNQNKQLILTAICSFICFAVFFRLTAFMWVAGMLLIVLLQFGTALLVILSWVYDKIYKTKSFRFSLIVLLVFWICFFAQKSIKKQITASIANKTEELILKIEDYNNQNGHYPASLNIDEFTDYDLNTAIGFPLIYKRSEDSTYRLHYRSFDGGYQIYNGEEWYWDD